MGTTIEGARRLTSHSLFRLSRFVSTHWIGTIFALTAVAVLGGIVALLLDGGWGAVSIFETCYGVVLTIGIFTWTLSGYASQEADRKRRGASRFAERIQSGKFGRGDLDPWHREELATFLNVDPGKVEAELLLWLVESSGVQGPRELLAVTQRHWFIRLVARGKGGRQVIDLATER